MDEHAGTVNTKVNMMSGVRELVEGAVFDQLFAINGTSDGDGYSKITLYQTIRNRILSHMKLPLEKEVESIRALNSTSPREALMVSSRKLISSPGMDLALSDVEQDIDEVLSSIPNKVHSYVFDRKIICKISVDGDPQATVSAASVSEIQGCIENDKFSSFDRRYRYGMAEQEIMMSRLRRASLAEVFETSCWVNVRVKLKQCLSSEYESVFFPSLNLHARYLLSSSNVAMYESFLNLKFSVQENFVCYKQYNDFGSLSKGIDLSCFSYVKLLKTMSLISEFFRDVSKKYVRLPLKLLEEVIGNLIDMISCFLDEEFGNSDEINTLNLFALIDPKALWAKRSLHHTSVRVITFRKISGCPKLVRYMLNSVSNWCKCQACQDISKLGAEFGNSVSGGHIRFATFSHCLHLFCYCFRYKEGRSIFLLSSGGVTFNEVLHSLIKYLNNAPMCKSTLVFHGVFITHITLLTGNILSNSLYKSLFLEPLFELHKVSQNLESREFSVIKSHIVDQLKLMLQSKTGIESFLFQRVVLESGIIEVTPARILLSHSCMCLRNYPSVPLNVMRKLLDCCVLIGRLPKGLAEVDESNIISVLAVLFCQLKEKIDERTFHVETMPENRYAHILDIVTVSITSLAAVLGRVWLIKREGVLLPVLQDLYSKPALPWGCDWFRRLLVSSTLFYGGCEALLAEKVQRMALLILWKSWFEDTVEDFSGKRFKALMSAWNDFLSLCSVVRGVKALLIQQEGSEETLVEGKNPPESLQELLECTLGIVEDPCKPNVSENVSSISPDTSSFQELHFGLRLLRFVLSSLDATLLLQHRFLIQEHLMKILVENSSEENRELVFNEITVCCDQILRHCFFMESCYDRGISQARTPRSSAICRPECFPEQWNNSLNCHYRSHSRRAPCRLKNGLVKFLGNTRHGLRDVNWLSQLRKAFHLAFCGNVSPEIKCNVLMEILEEVQKVSGHAPNLAQYKLNWSGDICQSVIFPQDLIGIKLAIRYGVKLNLLLSTPTVHSNLANLLRNAHGLVKISRNEFLGFDWFLATVFLVCCGNIDRCQLFISNLLRLPVAPFLWVSYGESLQSEPLGKNHVNDFIFLLIEQIEFVLSVEVPKVFAAFQLSSGSLAVLVHQWISQCFWNVLEWTEVKNFLCIAIIHEPDYIVYFCVAILFHLEPLILHIMSTSSENFWEQIKINPATHFHLGKYVPFIEKLCKTHHSSVIKVMMKCYGNFSKSP